MNEEFDLSNKNIMCLNIKENVEDYVNRELGDDEDVSNALLNIVWDANEIYKAIEYNLINNRFTSVNNWYDLAVEILDEIKNYPEMYEDNKKMVETIDNAMENGEEYLRDILIGYGWVLDRDNGVALLLDPFVKLKTHEYGN